MQALINIQSELKAPKNNRNTFGNYNYRSCEDILEAVKPLLKKHGCFITINDDIVNFADRFYTKATVTISDGKTSIYTSAYAREQDHKGMSTEQSSGACSSYARKYALSGLLAIDDNADADQTNDHGKKEVIKPSTPNNIGTKTTINNNVSVTSALATEKQRKAVYAISKGKITGTELDNMTFEEAGAYIANANKK